MAIRYLSGIDVDQNTLFVDDVNNRVGIGTASPAYPLDIVGFANSSSGFRVTDGTIDNRVSWSSGNVGFFGTVSNHPIAFNTNLTERMRITAAGNVGIGITAPAYKLDVDASFGVTFGVGQALRINREGLGNIGITGTKIYSGETLGFQSNDASTSFNFAYGNTSLMTIKSDGNVGIGTTSPGNKLHVAQDLGSGGVLVQFHNTNTTTSQNLYFSFNSSKDITWSQGSSNGGTVFNTGSRGHSFQVNGTTNIVFTSAGNVGIGTTAPVRKLDIVSGNAQLRLSDGTSGTYWELYSVFFQSNQDFIIQNNSGAALTINSSRSIGIGTSTPSQKLDVNGYSRATSGFVGSTTLKLFGDNSSTEFVAVNTNGSVQMTSYGGGSITGTVAYNLAVDSSGNIIETAGGVVDGSGTANYVSKWSDANTLTNSVLYDDGTDVGIGTTSPAPYIDGGAARGLQINNAGRAGIRLHDTGGVVQYFDIGVNGSTAFISAIYSQTPTIKYQAYSEHIFETNSSERMRITAAGNVGIGTTAPAGKLQIVDGSSGTTNNSSTTLYVENNGSSNSFYVLQTATIGGGKSFSITNAGNVGIGTTAPNQKLQVNGVIEAGPTSVAGGPMIYQTYGSPNYIGSIGSEYSSGAMLIGYGATGKNGASGYVSTFSNFPGIRGLIRLSSGEFSVLSSISAVQTAVGGDLTMTTNFIVTNAGNVGIGTTSPAYKLDVNGDINTSSGVYRIGGSTILSGTTSVAVGSSGATGSVALRTTSGDGLVLNGGNVGIGTTAPNYPIDLQRTTSPLTLNLRLSKSSTTNDYAEIAFQLWNGAGSGENTFGGSGTSRPSVVLRAINEDGGSAAGAFVVGTFTGGADNSTLTEKFRITSTGNVGIGTKSPSVKLHTVGDGLFYSNTNTNLTVNSNGGVATLTLTNGAGSQVIYGGVGGSNNMDFYTGSTFRMRIDPSGNVGIGTTSPSYKLDVEGDVGINDYIQHNGDNSRIGFPSNDVIALVTDNAERMRITSGGNVGIGTTSPGAKLDVYGASPTTVYESQLRIYSSETTGAQDTGGAIAFSGHDGVAGRTFGSIRSMKENSTVGNYAGYMSFGTRANNTDLVERMRILSNGDVAIGATYSVDHLYVSKTAGSSIGIGTGGVAGTVASPLYTSLNFRGYGDYIKGQIQSYDVSSNVVGGLLTFSVQDTGATLTERMRIAAAGNVLIGTTSAGVNGLLQVSGSIGLSGNTQIRQATNGDGNTLQVFATQFVAAPSNSMSYSYTGGGLIASVSSGDSALLFDSGRYVSTEGKVKIANTISGNTSFSIEKNGVSTFFASTAGNVGIGTTSPNALLHVNGTSFFFDQAIFDDKVGIGNTAPSQKLHVTGNVRVTGAYYDSSNSAGSSGQVLSSTGSGTDWVSLSEITGVDGTGTANYVAKWSDADTIANSQLFDNGTNVGIGTTSPNAKLQVVGTMSASNIISNNSSSNGTTVLAYQDQFKQVWTTLTSFSFTGAGVYYFNLVFTTNQGFTYDLTATTSREGLWRNFGALRDNSYLNVESDGDFETHAVGDVQIISNDMYLDAPPTAFKSATTTASGVNGTSPWAYYIVRYAVYIPTYAGNTDGFFKVHLTTYGYTGSAPLFINA